MPVVLKHLQRLVFVMVKAMPHFTDDGIRNNVTTCLKYAFKQIPNVNPASLIVGLAQEEVAWLQNMLKGAV